jgi:hypothetical protein
MRYTVREIMLALAIVAIFVGSYLNCQVANNAFRATQPLKAAGK